MKEPLIEKRYFEYEGKTLGYIVKDIVPLERKCKEMARAIMQVNEEKKDRYELVPVYDERDKVFYALPGDAKRWYESFLKEKR